MENLQSYTGCCKYYRLREGVKFVKEMPLTITGKVNRLKLKQKILNRLGYIN